MIKVFFRKILEHFPLIIGFLRNTRDLLDQRSPAVKTQWGFKFAGNEVMGSGNFEPEETKLIRKLLSEIDIFVNVGANVGYYCCHALSMGKPVIAIEPVARNLHYLLKNIRNNGWSKKVEVYPVALSETNNILKIWGSRTGASIINGFASIPESYESLVPTLSLDRVLGDALKNMKALIVVDIEGAELNMLMGAMQTLNNNPKPIWIMEILTTEHQPLGLKFNPNFKKTFQVFFDHGYDAYTADNKQHEISILDIDQIELNERKLETHNFLFLQKNVE